MANEAFRWVAHYADGSVLPEVDADGTEHGFAEIDQARLAAFVLEPARPGLHPVVLSIDGDARAIYFRRRVIPDVLAGGSGVATTTTVVGWQRTVNGRNVKAFTAIFEDGSVLVSDRDAF